LAIFFRLSVPLVFSTTPSTTNKFYNIASALTIFRRVIFLALALFCAAAASAEPPRRPLNPRKRRPAGAAGPAKPQEAPRILPGRWTKEIDRAVREFLEVRGSSGTAYDENLPPVAALAFDGAAYSVGDPSAAVFYRLVERGEFKFSEDFWKQVPLGYGRQKIRAAREQFMALPDTLWPSQPTYRQYRKYFLASYRDTCVKVGRKECRSYLARLLIGFTDEELRDYARAALDDEAKEPARVEKVGLDDVDPEPLLWQRGLVAAPEFAALVAVLRGAGIDVWTMAPQNQEILLEAATRAGVDASRVLGIKHFKDREKLTGQLREPIPVRGGALDAVLKSVGRAPSLVLGARREDFELLGYSAGLRLFIDDGDADVVKRAKAQGALLQPFFLPPRDNP
jgi:hypothetical protein